MHDFRAETCSEAAPPMRLVRELVRFMVLALPEDQRSGRPPQRQSEHAAGVGAEVRLPEAGTFPRQAPPVNPRGGSGHEGRSSGGTLDIVLVQSGEGGLELASLFTSRRAVLR